jgi:hypothetical protein
MAKDKKSFIAYSDWKETFDSIPDEVAGKLIKHIFAYVNDENPKTDDYVINGLFANIKNTLNRDLEKWKKQYNQRVEAGKKSAEIRKRNAAVVNERSVSSTVSGSVSVNVSEIYKEKDHLRITWDEMNKLIDEFGEEKADDYVNQVLNYRKNSKYKSLYLTALKWLKRDSATPHSEKAQNGKPKLAI